MGKLRKDVVDSPQRSTRFLGIRISRSVLIRSVLIGQPRTSSFLSPSLCSLLLLRQHSLSTSFAPHGLFFLLVQVLVEWSVQHKIDCVHCYRIPGTRCI